MKKNVKLIHIIGVLFAGLAALVAVRHAHALDIISTGSETQSDMVLFPGSFAALVSNVNQDPNAGAPGSKAGWHIPGRGYRAGTGWWALVCDADEKIGDDRKGCKLHSTQLSITNAVHGVYDSEPVSSQLLYWSPLPANLDKVPREDEKRPKLIAEFKPIRSLATLKLNGGPVSSYVHQGMTNYPAAQRPGTLEVRLSMGNRRYADIVPRIQLAAPKDEGQMAITAIATFEMRIGNQRQQLPGYGFCEMGGTGQLTRQDYLLWAGDLDGDGKPDLILNHGGCDIHVALYLSSLAKDGELVGVAGNFQYSDPSSAGC